MDDTPEAEAGTEGDETTSHAVRGPRLVPAHITEAKFDEQLRRWHANAETYTRRGWVLLATGDLTVQIGFLQNVAMGNRVIPVMTACVHLDYWNFDLWPPSVTFLDPLTRQPAPPPVRAPDRVSAEEVRDALIDQHPETMQPFLCLPGIREYHSHPQHSGDDWLLHRHLREGDLAVVCERIWRRMARNVLGMSVAIQSLAPAGPGIANQLDISLLQGDADLMQRQLADQQEAQLEMAQAVRPAQEAARPSEPIRRAGPDAHSGHAAPLASAELAVPLVGGDPAPSPSKQDEGILSLPHSDRKTEAAANGTTPQHEIAQGATHPAEVALQDNTAVQTTERPVQKGPRL